MGRFACDLTTPSSHSGPKLNGGNLPMHLERMGDFGSCFLIDRTLGFAQAVILSISAAHADMYFQIEPNTPSSWG